MTDIPASTVQRAQRGDEAASREIVEALHRPILATIYRFLGPRWHRDVEDLAQEVFLKVFRALDRFDPERYLDPRHDDTDNPWNWIPFGAGRHRCVGAAFAMMQLKTIFSVLLEEWTFEMAQPPETYRNDHSKMVVQLEQPCVVRYRRRAGGA